MQEIHIEPHPSPEVGQHDAPSRRDILVGVINSYLYSLPTLSMQLEKCLELFDQHKSLVLSNTTSLDLTYLVCPDRNHREVNQAR